MIKKIKKIIPLISVIKHLHGEEIFRNYYEKQLKKDKSEIMFGKLIERNGEFSVTI